MKRRFFAVLGSGVLGMLILMGVAFAQTGWVDDGTVVRLETTTDIVGIGTANPVTKLDLRQSADGAEDGISIANSLGGNNRRQLYVDNAGTFHIRWAATGADVQIDSASNLLATSFKAPSLIPGSVLFVGAGGLISQDNTNLFWENTNKRLGVSGAQTNLIAGLSIGGGGLELRGGRPGNWNANSAAIDYAGGICPGFECLTTRFWSVGTGNVSTGGTRGRFNFYIMDGSNNPAPPNELPVFTITNTGKIGMGDLTNPAGGEPEAGLTLRQFDNTPEGGMRITKAGGTPNDSSQLFMDSSGTFHIRHAATGSEGVVITSDGKVGVGVGLNAPLSRLQVNGGYVQLDDENSGAPPSADCNEAAESGRMYWDSTNDRLYVCSGASGWRRISTTAP